MTRGWYFRFVSMKIILRVIIRTQYAGWSFSSNNSFRKEIQGRWNKNWKNWREMKKKHLKSDFERVYCFTFSTKRFEKVQIFIEIRLSLDWDRILLTHYEQEDKVTASKPPENYSAEPPHKNYFGILIHFWEDGFIKKKFLIHCLTKWRAEVVISIKLKNLPLKK